MSKDSWQTPAHIIALVTDVLEYIDLDPASSHEANVTVGARKYASSGGLELDWSLSSSVFLNPPFSDVAPWAEKFIDEVEFGIMLTNADTSSGWFHELMDNCDSVCFAKKRISFINPETGLPSKSNPKSQALWYMGDWRKFENIFRRLGTVIPL